MDHPQWAAQLLTDVAAARAAITASYNRLWRAAQGRDPEFSPDAELDHPTSPRQADSSPGE